MKGYEYHRGAVKFQRLSIGLLLLFAFVFELWPLVFFVLLLLAMFVLLPPHFSPFYKFYMSIKARDKNPCHCIGDEVRVGCIFGITLLVAALVLKGAGMPRLAMTLVFIVSALSTVAGVSEFCLGSAVYLLFKRVLTGG